MTDAAPFKPMQSVTVPEALRGPMTLGAIRETKEAFNAFWQETLLAVVRDIDAEIKTGGLQIAPRFLERAANQFFSTHETKATERTSVWHTRGSTRPIYVHARSFYSVSRRTSVAPRKDGTLSVIPLRAELVRLAQKETRAASMTASAQEYDAMIVAGPAAPEGYDFRATPRGIEVREGFTKVGLTDDIAKAIALTEAHKVWAAARAALTTAGAEP